MSEMGAAGRDEVATFASPRPETGRPVADDQAWFWTPEWQAGEREADEDIAAGNVERFADFDAFVGWLNGPPESGRGENLAENARPIVTRPVTPYVPPAWEDGPPTLIAIVALIAAGLAVLGIGLFAMGVIR